MSGTANSTTHYKNAIAHQIKRVFTPLSVRRSPLTSVNDFSDYIDDVIQRLYGDFIDRTDLDKEICLVGLGGYGRRELCPFSDIDVLVLHTGSASTEAIAAFVRALWDSGLNLGCVSRTLDECATILGKDIATDSAFLESRFLAGNKILFKTLENSVTRPYFERAGKNISTQFRDLLHTRVFDEEHAIYRTEPDLKNGVCALRDCHRLLWSEHLRVGLTDRNELRSLSHLPAAACKKFSEAYNFLLGLRSGMHIICNRRMDVLEFGLQNQVAEFLGFAPERGPRLLMERYYRSVREVRFFILSWLEKYPGKPGLWNRVHRRIASRSVLPGISVCEGIFFSDRSKNLATLAPAEIMSIFSQALIHRAIFSVELLNRIRTSTEALSPTDFVSQDCANSFRQILAFDGPVGQIFHLLHDTQVLGKLIPQFDAITCRVEYDSYHEFTIDQHTILTLYRLDDCVRDPDPVISSFRLDNTQRFILRFSLLLHDLGKSLGDDHTHTGTHIAETLCERFGLNDTESHTVKFLVQNHLELSRLSFERELEESNVREFARSLPDPSTLKLLYLLTVVDIRAVGNTTWTGWKAHLLAGLYERIALTGSRDVRQNSSYIANIFDYRNHAEPGEQQLWDEWLGQVDEKRITIHQELLNGFERYIVCGKDRLGFLRDLIGCITAEGYNILSARIFSTSDKKALDIFHLEPPRLPNLRPGQRPENIIARWNLISIGQRTTDELVRERSTRYPEQPRRRQKSLEQVDVRIDNDSSAIFTIVEVNCQDSFGLFYSIAHTLCDLSINIHAARISTRIDRAVDVLYVSDVNGAKLTDKTVIDSLQSLLIATLQSLIKE